MDKQTGTHSRGRLDPTYLPIRCEEGELSKYKLAEILLDYFFIEWNRMFILWLELVLFSFWYLFYFIFFFYYFHFLAVFSILFFSICIAHTWSIFVFILIYNSLRLIEFVDFNYSRLFKFFHYCVVSQIGTTLGILLRLYHNKLFAYLVIEHLDKILFITYREQKIKLDGY